MGMAANMAAIVPAALLEHGTRAGKLVYCMYFMFITGPQPATFVTCLGYWERELNGLTRRRPGGGPRGVVHRRVVYYVSCLSGPEPYTPV
jgi:hypothetical protein